MPDAPSVPDFIVIDDDAFYNLICRRCIGVVFPSADISTFTDASAGVEHMRARYQAPTANGVFLFLDINMPFLNGWDVLEKMNYYTDATKRRITVFMMSSSVALADKETAEKYKMVSGYIEKPLTVAHLKTMFPERQF